MGEVLQILSFITLNNQVNKFQLLIFFIIFTTGCSENPFTSSERRILELHNNRNISSRTFQQYNQASTKTQQRLVLASANSGNEELLFNLIDLYSKATPVVRQYIAFALSQFDQPEARNFLIKALKTESVPEVKEQLLLSMGKLGEEKDLTWILESFWDNGQKLSLLQTIGYFFDRDIISSQAAQVCIQSLKSDRPDIRFEAATTLTRFDDIDPLQQNFEVITKAYQNSSVETRQKLLNILGELKFDNKDELFLKALNDYAEQIQIEAARHLPALQSPQPLILQALNMDLSSNVIASLLSNLPSKNTLIQSLEPQLIQLAKRHPSQHVQGLAFQYLIELKPLQNATIIPENPQMIPYKIVGFYKSGEEVVLDSLFKYSLYSDPAISTPAFSYLLDLFNTHLQDSGRNQKMKQYIAHGLTDKDPVKAALAARYYREIGFSDLPVKEKIYTALSEIVKTGHAEAALELIETIKYLQPHDAVQHLWPLLNCKIYAVASKARQVLVSLYQISPDQIDDYTYQAPPQRNLKKLVNYGLTSRVRFSTERGYFTIQLDGYFAPFTCSSFLKLVEEDFYDGLTFHRIVPNFVVQGGDPRGDGWGGPDFTLLTESSMRSFIKGSVGMANAGANTEGSQFFITTTYQPHLDYQYTRFGEIVSGMAVIQQLQPDDRILTAEILP